MDVKHPWSGVCRRASIAVGNAIKHDFAADVILANVEFISDARIYHKPGRAPRRQTGIGGAPCRRTREWTLIFRTPEQCRLPNRQVKSITPKGGAPWTG
jgi:hypothetical protein